MAARVDLTRLTAAVTNDATVNDSAETLITGLAEQLRAVAGDAAAVNALADALDAQSAKLATAVTANTPAAEPAPPA
jgi:hypothetical protein